jgi:delta8-fatty-acid desaturase
VQRYRIGRVSEPWITNFTPPIQGGAFRVLDEEENEQEWATTVDTYDGTMNRMIGQVGGGDSPVSIPTMPVLQKTRRKQTAPHVIEAPLPPDTYLANRIQHDIGADLSKYPSLDGQTQQSIARKFRALHQQIKDDGFYECPYSKYGEEILRYATLFSLFVMCLSWNYYFVAACFLGLFWHQIMFSAHDAGHRGITHDFTMDTMIGIFIADFCCGLSIGWWKSSHNVHHLVPNLPVTFLSQKPTLPTTIKQQANIQS